MAASAKLQRILMVALVVLVGAIVFVLVGPPGSAHPPPARTATGSQFNGPTMPPGVLAHDFTLREVSGRRVTLSAYRGHVVVLTFIHSLCHDTCPFMVEQIKGALNLLPPGGRRVAAIGVSADPPEDTVAHRRAFLVRHGMLGRLAFVNGPEKIMGPIWRAYAVAPVTPKVDHSTFVILIDKRGFERVGFAADELTPEGLAHDIRVLEHEPS